MTRCKNCGLDYEGNFCPRCGAPANFTPPPPQQQYQPQQPTIQPQPGYQMPPNQQMHPYPPKKKKKKGCLIAIIVVLVIFFLFALIPTDDTSSNKSTSQKEVQKEDPETYKSQCQSIPYDELARTPDNYEGQKVTFTGQIIQVRESGDEATYRINVTQDEYGLWDDTIFCTFDLSTSESRFLEDDIVTFYGDYDGLYTYTSIMGSDVTLPSVTIHYMNLSQ